MASTSVRTPAGSGRARCQRSTAPVGFEVDHDSPVVGGQIGIQHQFGNFVLGVEGTLTVAFQDDYASTACPNPAFTCALRFDDVITIGPRLGWAMGKWMPYLTGGYASAAFDQKISLNTASSNPYGDRSATAAGTSAAAWTWPCRMAGRLGEHRHVGCR